MQVQENLIKASREKGEKNATLEEMIAKHPDQARLRKQLALKLKVNEMYKHHSDDKSLKQGSKALLEAHEQYARQYAIAT